MAQSSTKLDPMNVKVVIHFLEEALDELRYEYSCTNTPASQTLGPFGMTPQLLTPDTLPPPLHSNVGTPFSGLTNLPQANIPAPNSKGTDKKLPRIPGESKHSGKKSRIPPTHSLLLSSDEDTKPAKIQDSHPEPQNLNSKLSGTSSADLYINTTRICDTLLCSQRSSLWDHANQICASIKECSKVTKGMHEELEHWSQTSNIAMVLSAALQPCKDLADIFEELLLTMRRAHLCMGICTPWHERYNKRFALFAQDLDKYLNRLLAQTNVRQLGVLLERYCVKFRQWLSKIKRYYDKFDMLVLQEEIKQMKVEQVESRHEHKERQRHHPDGETKDEEIDKRDAEMTERIRECQGRLKNMMLRYLDTA